MPRFDPTLFRRSVAVLACLASPALAMVRVAPGQPDAAEAQAALVAAYRGDLKDMTLAVPVYLSYAEGELLARHLGVRVDVFMHAESRKTPGGLIPLVRCATFNTAHARSAPLALLLHARHYSLLRAADSDAEAAYARLDNAGMMTEAGEPLPDGHGEFRRVPADGNCLVSALFFIANGHYPDRGEIGILREIVASALSHAQALQAVADLRADLIQNAASSPFERGTYISCGPRVSALLRADPTFRAARERQLAAYLDLRPGRGAGPEVVESKAGGKAKPFVRAGKVVEPKTGGQARPTVRVRKVVEPKAGGGQARPTVRAGKVVESKAGGQARPVPRARKVVESKAGGQANPGVRKQLQIDAALARSLAGRP